MNRVKVTICGKEYALKTEEAPNYFIVLGRKVENTINQMTAQCDSLSVQSAAVLAALSAFDEAQKANESIDNIRTQIKEYVDEACRARAERDEAVKETEALKAKITELENALRIEEMKNTIDTHLADSKQDKNKAGKN
ncbi:MAG: cell division protein ZapA [Oscillospiraceae bacterium]|nr:cell division protein ZapA [Oscillospiraceae bacterium]